jgi:aryl-alcohol dehydrogenase-like predicted oxidoreductase
MDEKLTSGAHDPSLPLRALGQSGVRVPALGVGTNRWGMVGNGADQLMPASIPLAANEVQFSIFHRNPERNGVLEACRKLDVALIAYRPLSGERNRPDGSALDRALADISSARQKTVAQVALNWLLSKDERVIPIPGASKAEHLRDNVGTVGWTLSDDELVSLDQAAR